MNRIALCLTVLASITMMACVADPGADDGATGEDEVNTTSEALSRPQLEFANDRLVAPELRTTNAWQDLALSSDANHVAFLQDVPYGLSDMKATRFVSLAANDKGARFGSEEGFDLVSVLPGANGGAILEPRFGNLQRASAFLKSQTWVKLRMTHAADNDIFHIGKYAVAMQTTGKHDISVSFGGKSLTTLSDAVGFGHAPIKKGPTTCTFRPALSGVAIAPVRRVVVVKVAQSTSNDACSLPAQYYAFDLPQ